MRGMSVKQLVAGKHSCIGNLSHASTTGFDEELHLERPAMLVYCGKFQSMDGEVEVEEHHIDRLLYSHNARVDRLLKLANNQDDVFVRGMPPLQVDHSTSAHDTVGRVVGKLSKAMFKNEDGVEVPALYCDKVRVLGKENMERVRDGRWSNLSIGADLEQGNLNELSITPFPAALSATLLKAKMAGEAETTSEGDLMHEKLKKRLMEHHQLSEKDADEMLSKMSAHVKAKLGLDDEKGEAHMAALSDEDADKLKGEVDEELKKLASEKEEHEKQLTAKRASVVQLAKGLRKDLSQAKLTSKTVELRAKLSGLKATGKITPAELKKINFAELAGKPESEMKAVVKSYEDREPVIDARIHGTTRAVNLAKLQADAKAARLEAETRKDMGLTLTAEQKTRLAEEAPVAPKEQGAPAGNPHDEYMAHLSKMLEGYDQRDAVMAHVKQMLEQYSPVGETTAEGADPAQMSALAETVNRLQTQFHDLIALMGDLSGIESKELTE